MSKRLIWTLGILMAIATVGLVVVQNYWLKKAIAIRHDQFAQQVNKTLQRVVDRVQAHETVSKITDEVVSYDQDKSLDTKEREFMQQLKEHFTDSTIINLNLSTGNGAEGTKPLYYTQDTFVFHKKKTANDQVYNEFDSKRFAIKKNLSGDLENRTVFIQNIVNKLIRVDLDIEDRIAEPVLKGIIAHEFSNNGIDLAFEYAIERRGTEYPYQSGGFSVKPEEATMFQTQLFPDDYFSEPNTLKIYFPEEKKWFIQSLGLLATSSILLTFIVILSFFLTFYIFFRERKLSRVKTDFINNMTHELKTPISTIMLASQMLKDDSIPAEAKNFAYVSNVIEEEGKRLSFQVEKVLQMAVLDKGRINFKWSEVSVNNMLQNIGANYLLQVQNKEGRISVQLNATKDMVSADRVHLTNVATNLLDNALKYCDKAPNITIRTFNRKKMVVMVVEDNGIGISKEHQKRIFEKFYRVPTGNLHNVKGFGLGLSYVKKVVDEHRGVIALTSEEGKGSTFEVSLPLSQ